MISMTLEVAIARALEMNLDVQTARLSPLIQDFSLQAARAAFNPTFSSTFAQSSSSNQSTSPARRRGPERRRSGKPSTPRSRRPFRGTADDSVPISTTVCSSTNNSFATRNPSYNSTVSFNYTQPLLAGLRTDDQRSALQTQEIPGADHRHPGDQARSRTSAIRFARPTGASGRRSSRSRSSASASARRSSC